ncbi:MAG: hypothetical protein WCC59_08450, partial [Terriglobales bacterium]
MQDGIRYQVDQLKTSSAFTFARSLFHAAEGEELFKHRMYFASAVSVYYSFFHLGVALILAYWSQPPSQDEHHTRLRKALEKWKKIQSPLPSEVPDPGEDVGHQDVRSFLTLEIPEFLKTLDAAKQMREFVSYGPRVRSDGNKSIVYSGCQYTAEDFSRCLKQNLNAYTHCLRSAVRWLKEKGHDEIRGRVLSASFILFEFNELRSYHPEPVVNRAWAVYRSLCEHEGLDWREYNPDPLAFSTDEDRRRERYANLVRFLLMGSSAKPPD